jgi:hypothetical protein
VNFEYIAPRLVQPCDYDNFIAHFEIVDPLHCEPIHLQPGVGGAFGSLLGRAGPRFDYGSDCGDRAQRSKPRASAS